MTTGSKERFDVIVIGARCAGSPLATFLKRAGLNVCVLDQTDFPSDTLSTHMFQIGGMEVMQKLGVLGAVMDTGAPPMTNCYLKFEDVDLSGGARTRPGDVAAPLLCVRRITLDIRLVEMAQEAGVEMRLNTRVVDLLRNGDRVTGVRVSSRAGKTSEIKADLVVGADGRLSTTARLVESRRYHVLPSERMSTWAYFKGAQTDPVPTVYYHRRGDDFVVGAPADGDLFLVAVCPSVEAFDQFRVDSERTYNRAIAGCPPLVDLLSRAERVTKFRGLTRFEGYFREAAGPGWVLVGDSGHFKDPLPGQGISDALRQVDKLSDAIIQGFRTGKLDQSLKGWWQWRDRDAIQHYWFCSDIGKRGPISPLFLEILRPYMKNEEQRLDFLDIFLHRKYPRQMFGPTALLSAAVRMMANPAKRPGAIDETYKLVREYVGRRWHEIRPQFNSGRAVDEPHVDHQPSVA